MTSTIARAILAIASHDDELGVYDRNAILAALLPASWVSGPRSPEQGARYLGVVNAIMRRDGYERDGELYAAVMLAADVTLGDPADYLIAEVDREGEGESYGYDPALAAGPEMAAWAARARELAEKMAQAEAAAQHAPATR